MSTLQANPVSSPSAPSSPAPSPAPVHYAPAPLPAQRRGISLRLALLLGLVAAPFVYFGYVIVDQAMNKGVVNRGSYYDVDLKSLGYFPFDADKDGIDDIPQRWRGLDGKRVALVGEMWTGGSSAPKVSAFELVYSIQKCCFGGPPKVQERVFAKVPNGGTVPYHWQAVRVVGTLHVGVKRDETGQIISVYEMDVDSVDPA
jgi:hypothetical protein